MVKKIALGLLGTMIGMVAGMVLMMGLHLTSFAVYPLPEGVHFTSPDPVEQEKVAAWIGTLPAGAFVLALLAHGFGCMGGAALATLISGRRSFIPAVLVGIFFTIGGVMNLDAVPHPAWFPFVDIPIYLLLALVAWRLLRRKVAED